MKLRSNWGGRLGKKSSGKKGATSKSGWGFKKTKSAAETKPLPGEVPVSYDVQDVKIADITVNDDRRALKDATVKELMESISRLGLREPITVRPGVRGKYVLVDGLHRLEAMKQTGHTTIPCFIMKGDERDTRMWEISANLHRADLTPEEYDEQLAEWVRLWEERQAVSGQNVRKRGSGRPKSGMSEAARHLPVKGKSHEAKRKRVARALKNAAIAPEAKKAANKAGLNQSQRFKVAEEKTPEAQVAKVRELAVRKSKAEKKRRPLGVTPKMATEAELESTLSVDDKGVLAEILKKWSAAPGLQRALIKASPAVREVFITKIRLVWSSSTDQNSWIN